MRTFLILATALLVSTSSVYADVPANESPLSITSHIDLPGYEGDFDHFETDVAGNRLFLAAEDHHRLFMVTRKPGKILVLNSDTDATLATFDAPARVDQIVWDEKHRRAYAMGGEGWMSIIEERDPDTFVGLPRLTTAPGAKTRILVPRRNELFVAVSPGENKTMAQVLRISTGS